MSAAAPPASAILALRRIWQEGRSTPGFGAMIACSLLAAVLNSAIILPISMDRVVTMLEASDSIGLVLSALGLAFALLLAGYCAEWAANRLAAQVNQRICLRLVDRQLSGYLGSPLARFQQHATLTYGAAIGEVTEGLQTHQLYVLQTAVISLAVTALSLLILAQFDLWFAVIMLPFLLAICGLPMLLASRAGAFIAAEPAAFAALGQYVEAVVGARRELYFAPTANLLREGERRLDSLHHAQTGKWWIWNLSFNLKLTQNLALNALTLLVGGLLYLNGQISLGTVVGGYLMVSMIAPKFDGLYKLYNFAQASAAAYAALDRCELPIAQPPSAQRTGEAAVPIQSISLDVTDFCHAQSAAPVIRRASLRLAAGDRCLITGASGSGKSTLIDLLLGLLTGPMVQAAVNGTPLESFGTARLWHNTAFVPNPDLLFDQLAARDNLALYGEPAFLARPEWTNALGWQGFAATPAGDLSGGERQRLALLRALSRERGLLVLDEPTAALDQANIEQAFTLLTRAPASIVIVASHSAGADRHFNRHFDMRGGILRELS